MNLAVTDKPPLGLILPEAATFDEWVAVGRDLAAKKRSIDWMLGDWIVFGRAHYPEQIELALGDVIGDELAFRRIERTVKAFPPHLRDAELTSDHHAHVADLPVQEALPILKEARTEHYSSRRVRIVAMLHKVRTGQILPREEDAEDDALLALVRSWNRAPGAVREDFADMVADSHLGLIDFAPPKDNDP